MQLCCCCFFCSHSFRSQFCSFTKHMDASHFRHLTGGKFNSIHRRKQMGVGFRVFCATVFEWLLMQLSTRPRRYKAAVGSQNTAAASLESHRDDAALIEASAAGKRNPQKSVKGCLKLFDNTLLVNNFF